jgi:hypothetical protein
VNNLVDLIAGPVVMGSNTGVRSQFGHIQANVIISCYLNDPYANGWIDTGSFYQFQDIPDFRRGAHGCSLEHIHPRLMSFPLPVPSFGFFPGCMKGRNGPCYFFFGRCMELEFGG